MSENIRQKDFDHYARKQPSQLEYLMEASNRYQVSPMSLGREYLKLRKSSGRITLQEFVQYGVCNPELSQEEKERFITNHLHWPIVEAIDDMSWQATTEDKWLCSHILERSNVAIPETLAVIDRSARQYPGTRKISTAADLREFVLAQSGVPFFAKENRGIASFGVFLVDQVEEDRLHLSGEGWFSYEDAMESYVGDTSYLVQPVARNHSFFDAYTDHLATVRMCILADEEGVRVPFAVLKLPAKGVIADSFWREGNLACGLDPETGKILTARTKNFLGTTDYDLHPQTEAPLVGQAIPQWEALLDMVASCAPIFQPIAYQSMDIALTEEGPMLIEINTGGGFDLPQLATGKGFLTDEVREFFKAKGYDKL